MKKEMQTSKEYIPGTCNIGPTEIRRRKNATIFSLILTIVVIALILVLHLGKLWRLSLFVPMAAIAVNFQQVYFKFCVNFGLRGIFNFGNLGQHDTVEQAEFRRKDRTKAIKMIVVGILIGLIVTLTFYYLPF
jgi:predicted nucleic acid-binding Zn ribbon protein